MSNTKARAANGQFAPKEKPAPKKSYFNNWFFRAIKHNFNLYFGIVWLGLCLANLFLGNYQAAIACLLFFLLYLEIWKLKKEIRMDNKLICALSEMIMLMTMTKQKAKKSNKKGK